MVPVLAAAALAGCTAASPDATEPPVPSKEQSWTQVQLPEGFVGSQLLVVDGRLVVAGSASDAPAVLVAADGDPAALAQIPVVPDSFYGARALWYSFIADGSRIRALGGRTGGGHGNPRWSTWTGTVDQLTEQRGLGIEVFGGERGGGMVGVAVADGQAVIVGGRVGDVPGQDIAVWLEAGGDDWVEQSSTGTPLGASSSAIPFATSVVTDGDGLLITGFQQLLGGGTVHLGAAVWSGTPNGPWSRIELDSDADEASADAASCDDSRCVVIGRADGRLAAWRYIDGEASVLNVPDAAMPKDSVLPPVTWGGRTALVLPDGAASQIAVSDDLDTWNLVSGPEGIPVAAAASGVSLFVLTAAVDGTVRLWSASASASTGD